MNEAFPRLPRLQMSVRCPPLAVPDGTEPRGLLRGGAAPRAPPPPGAVAVRHRGAPRDPRDRAAPGGTGAASLRRRPPGHASAGRREEEEEENGARGSAQSRRRRAGSVPGGHREPPLALGGRRRPVRCGGCTGGVRGCAGPLCKASWRGLARAAAAGRLRTARSGAGFCVRSGLLRRGAPGAGAHREPAPGLGALPVWLACAGGTGTASRVGSDPWEQAAGWQRPKSAVTRRCQRVGTVPLFGKAGEAVPGLGTEHLLAARPVPSCLQQGPRAKETERCPRWTRLSSGCQQRAAQPGHTASPSSPPRI